MGGCVSKVSGELFSPRGNGQNHTHAPSHLRSPSFPAECYEQVSRVDVGTILNVQT